MRGGNAYGDYSQLSGGGYNLTIHDLKTYQERNTLKDAALEWSWTFHGTVLCYPVKPG